MEKTGEFGHGEDPTSPWYTEAGAEAGGSSVLAKPLSLPRDAWEDAPYHRTSVLDPRLRISGYDASGGSTCMRVDGIDNSPEARTPMLSAYPWPPDNAVGVPTSQYRGSESPDPCELVPPGGDYCGFGETVSFNGPWDSSSFIRILIDRARTSLVPDGGASVPIDVDTEDYDVALLVIPHRPLGDGQWYTAHVAGNVTRKEATWPFDLTWRFRTVGLDPETYVDISQRRVQVDTESAAPVELDATPLSGLGAPTTHTFQGPGRSVWQHQLPPGRWRFCFSQTFRTPYEDFEECDETTFRGSAKLRFARPRVAGKRVAFGLLAEEPLVGEHATITIKHYRRSCGYYQPPIPGAPPVRTCGLKPVRKKRLARTLAAKQTINAGKRPKKNGKVTVKARVKPFDRNGVPYMPARATASFRR